jgi:hypothetical protein
VVEAAYTSLASNRRIEIAEILSAITPLTT